ncbi:hypothetical protein SLA2020_200330 [Shorea laevis]
MKQRFDGDGNFDFLSHGFLTKLPLSMLEADGTDLWLVFQRKKLPDWVKSGGIFFNTVEEFFDRIGMSYFWRKLNGPVWTIGPILLST